MDFEINIPDDSAYSHLPPEYLSAERALFPPFLDSVSGMQSLSGYWLTSAGFSQCTLHHFWQFESEIASRQRIMNEELCSLWNQRWVDGREAYLKRIEQWWHEAQEIAPNLYQHAKMEFSPSLQFWNKLETRHLVSYHTEHYASHLGYILSLLTQAFDIASRVESKYGYAFNLRHPIVTPDYKHRDIMGVTSKNFRYRIHGLNALSTDIYSDLWQSLEIPTRLPAPWLYPEHIAYAMVDADPLFAAYHHWHRFNAYGTVTTQSGSHFGAVHPAFINPWDLHDTRNEVSVKIWDEIGFGIWDESAVYTVAGKTSTEDDWTPLIDSTSLLALICQLMTAYANGRKTGRGITKTRWSSSPANVTHGKILFAIAPAVLKTLEKNLL